MLSKGIVAVMADFLIRIAALCVASYFVGGIHFASIIARLKGVNIRKLGSGNPGTMNMLRNFGLGTAILTLVLDALKGAVPSLVGYLLLANNTVLGGVSAAAPAFMGYYIGGASKIGVFVGGLSVIIGHIFPAVHGFKGGKGVASSVGVLLVANPIVGLIAFAMAFTYLYFFKYGSVASFVFLYTSIITEVVLAVVFKDSYITLILILALCGLITWAHRANIIRLFKGQESDINIRRQLRKKKEGKLLGAKPKTGQPSDNGGENGSN